MKYFTVKLLRILVEKSHKLGCYHQIRKQMECRFMYVVHNYKENKVIFLNAVVQFHTNCTHQEVSFYWDTIMLTPLPLLISNYS